jgi:hypothetical protein
MDEHFDDCRCAARRAFKLHDFVGLFGQIDVFKAVSRDAVETRQINRGEAFVDEDVFPDFE